MRLITFLFAIGSCHATSFTENWMSEMKFMIGSQTLLDITLPGCHDCTTGDSSKNVAEELSELPSFINTILTTGSQYIPYVNDFVKALAKTQGLQMEGFLNGGIRFFDFRIIYDESDWYGVHFVRTNQKAIEYLKVAKTWLENHPDEILVFWLSQHGSECNNDQYLNTPDSAKQAFWNEIETLFQGLLFDTTKSTMKATTINELISSNQRVIFYAGDYARFTSNSKYAQDSCLINNQLGGNVANQQNAQKIFVNALKTMDSDLANDKSENKFYLRSMASSMSSDQIKYAALCKYASWVPFTNYCKTCAAQYNIPNSNYCPKSLQEVAQMANYYSARALEHARETGSKLPNAIYIDAIDVDGTIRVGTEDFSTSSRRRLRSAQPSTTAKYSYVATLLQSNVERLNCISETCNQLLTKLEQANMYQQFDLPDQGRIENWPSF